MQTMTMHHNLALNVRPNTDNRSPLRTQPAAGFRLAYAPLPLRLDGNAAANVTGHGFVLGAKYAPASSRRLWCDAGAPEPLTSPGWGRRLLAAACTNNVAHSNTRLGVLGGALSAACFDGVTSTYDTPVRGNRLGYSQG
jgi:hypothetical protein